MTAGETGRPDLGSLPHGSADDLRELDDAAWPKRGRMAADLAGPAAADRGAAADREVAADRGAAPDRGLESTTAERERNVADPAAQAERDADLRLSRLHLRTGSLLLARAELEALNAGDPLEGGALLDLAEVRWRTGEIGQAGEAAQAYLDLEGDDPAATVIAVEAALADGRRSDASSLQARSASLDAADIDLIFAGMPRGDLWPPDPMVALPPGEMPAGRWAPGQPVHGQRAARSGIPSGGPAVPGLGARTVEGRPETATGAGLDSGAQPGPDSGAQPGPDSGAEPGPEAAGQLAAARGELDAGELSTATVRLALALRRWQGIAADVIELVEGRTDPLVVLLRGDALRSLGREVEATDAWQAASRQLPQPLGLLGDAQPHLSLIDDAGLSEPDPDEPREGDLTP